MTPVLGYVKLTDSAFAPERATPNSAGYDLRAPYHCFVPAKGKVLIQTDLAFEFPKNTYGRIAPRSSLALNYFIDVGAGVVDQDFTGNVGVLLFNHSVECYEINRGDKIAQIIIEVILTPELLEIKQIRETDRGEKGFGSTVESSQWDSLDATSFLEPSASTHMQTPSTLNTPILPLPVMTKGKERKGRKEKIPTANQKSGNDDFTLKAVIELLIVLGLTSANAWEKTIIKIKKYVSDAMNVELTNLYFSLRLISQSVCAGVAHSSDLSQEKLEQINEYERSYEELMSYITPTLNAVAATTFSKECVKTMHSFVSLAINDNDKEDKCNENQSTSTTTSTHKNLSAESLIEKFFGGFDKKRKVIKNAVINQIFTLRDEDVVRKFSTPGESGQFMVKIEITDCDDLRGVPTSEYWTKVWKKCVFLVDNEDHPALKSIQDILNNQVTKIMNIKDVQMSEYDTSHDGPLRKRKRFSK